MLKRVTVTRSKSEPTKIISIQATNQQQLMELIASLDVLHRLQSLERIYFEGLSDGSSNYLKSKINFLAQLSCLTHLQFKLCKLYDKGLSRTLSKLTNIKSLGLVASATIQIDWITTNLETLLVPYWGDTSDHFIGLSRLKHLKHLDLTESCMFEDQSVKYITPLVSLENLTIYKCEVSPSGFKDICLHLTNLTSFSFLEAEHLTKKAFRRITNMTRLQALSIFLPQQAAEHLCTLTNITTLHIHSIEGSLFPGFSSVKALSKLEQFAINLNEKREIGPVLQTVSVLPKLDYLWIRNCEQMQTEHLKYIADLKYLTQLQLGSPIQLHNDSFQYVSTLTNLQVLKFSRCLQLDPAIIKSYWSNCNVEYEKWNINFNWNTTPYF